MNKPGELLRLYQEIDIPEDLEFTIRKIILNKEKRMKKNRIIKAAAATAAAIILIFVGSVNASPAMANAMSDIPVLKNLVQLVTIREMVYEDENHEAQVKVPEVTGLADQQLESALNEKYLEESTKLYNDFLNEVGEAELTPAKLGLFTNYNVKTNTDDLYVIESIKTEIAASGSESVHYDNIDLKNQLIITLPGLFKDDSYIDVISDNIKKQMQDQMAADENLTYFIDANDGMGGFSKISPDQPFYINADHKLAIAFNEYDVAPGFMGIVEFVVPTEAIQDILVSNTYVK